MLLTARTLGPLRRAALSRPAAASRCFSDVTRPPTADRGDFSELRALPPPEPHLARMSRVSRHPFP
jgi:hypothetical protein